jgi:hypothetical protein
VLPDAFFLEGSEEALDHAVLLRRVGRDELLLEAVVLAGRPETTGLEDQPVVAANGWCLARWSERSKATNAGLLDRALGFLGASPKGELDADDGSSGLSGVILQILNVTFQQHGLNLSMECAVPRQLRGLIAATRPFITTYPSTPPGQ